MAASILPSRFRNSRRLLRGAETTTSKNAGEPFKQLTVSKIRRLCRELSPSALKVWLYHYSLSGKGDTSFPRLDTIARATNQNVQTVMRARKFLRDGRWLVTTGWRRVARLGRGVPIELATFPAQAQLKVENPPLTLSVEKPPVEKSTIRSRFKTPEVHSLGFGSAEKLESDKSSSEVRDDDSALRPDWDSIEPKIQQRIEEAKNILLRKGWDPHFVGAALAVIEERSDYSGTVPSSANYFLAAVSAAMADPRDKAEITKRAARRARVMPSDSELRRVAVDLERESQTSGRSVAQIAESRSRGAVVNGTECGSNSQRETRTA
jgi:hypothetical protein